MHSAAIVWWQLHRLLLGVLYNVHAATPFRWPIKPRACAVVRVNNSRSIWENIDPHGYGKILILSV